MQHDAAGPEPVREVNPDRLAEMRLRLLPQDGVPTRPRWTAALNDDVVAEVADALAREIESEMEQWPSSGPRPGRPISSALLSRVLAPYVMEVDHATESGALELQVRCYVDPEHRHPKRHPILLHRDWSVDTGHDLETERFSVVFGAACPVRTCRTRSFRLSRSTCRVSSVRPCPRSGSRSGGGWR